MVYWRCHECHIQLARQNLIDKLEGIAMCRLNLASRKHLSIHFASCIEELPIDERRAPKSESIDLAILNGYQRRNSLIPCVEEIPGNRYECDAGICYLYTAILTLTKESKGEVVLELFCLGAEIRLGGMNMLRSGSQSSVFQNRKQIPEVTKLGQVIHAVYLLYDVYERTIKYQATPES